MDIKLTCRSVCVSFVVVNQTTKSKTKEHHDWRLWCSFVLSGLLFCNFILYFKQFFIYLFVKLFSFLYCHVCDIVGKKVDRCHWWCFCCLYIFFIDIITIIIIIMAIVIFRMICGSSDMQA